MRLVDPATGQISALMRCTLKSAVFCSGGRSDVPFARQHPPIHMAIQALHLFRQFPVATGRSRIHSRREGHVSVNRCPVISL
jgi:hypothetical protein